MKNRNFNGWILILQIRWNYRVLLKLILNHHKEQGYSSTTSYIPLYNFFLYTYPTFKYNSSVLNDYHICFINSSVFSLILL